MYKTHWSRKVIVIFMHALIGWGLCGAIISIGRNLTSMENTLILHAMGVPIIFACLSLIYFRIFNYTTPFQTAAIFFTFAILMDVTVIAMLVEKSFAMFRSLLGTWIPFGLIYASTYLVGRLTSKKASLAQASTGAM
jgi:hypothetical protein